jgi:hypothetical protein
MKNGGERWMAGQKRQGITCLSVRSPPVDMPTETKQILLLI